MESKFSQPFFTPSLIVFGVLVLGGCLGQRAVNLDLSNSPDAKNSPCSPVSYTKIEASAERRPPWVLVAPGDEGGNHYLVGISGFHATERDARDEAMRYARGEFAKYTGVEVAELDEISRVIYGKTSSILDPTVEGKSQSKQETDAMVRRTRAKEWYFETLRASCRGEDKGIAYQYWVLAEVPAEEYDKVQEWKAKREAAKEAEKAAEQVRIREEVERLAVSHQAALGEAETLIASADPMAALTVLQADWSRLYDAGKSLEIKGLLVSPALERLHALQREIPSAVQRVRSSLILDPGRMATVWIPSGNEGLAEISVWVWYRREDRITGVSGIPLLLREVGGIGPVFRGRSQSDGQAVFQAKVIKPGNYEVSVDPQGGFLISLAPPIQEALSAVGATLYVKSYMPSMDGAIQAGVQQLFKGPSLKPPPAKKVVIGSVRYRDTRFGSEFGKRLETLIEREIAQVSQVNLIRRPITRGLETLVQADRARGVGLTDRPLPPMGSPAMQAELDGAEAALETSYSLNGKEVNVDLRLIEAGTGRTLAAAGARIDRALIPNDLQLIPPFSGNDLAPITSGQPGEIHLELTTQRGDGATFAEGEKIQYFVSANRDAYLILLYKDASGRLIQIYPNARSGNGFHKAGEYMEIPDRMSVFDFTITSPFGSEQVWAFAATIPFPSLKPKDLSNGLAVLQQDLIEAAAQLRAHGRKSGAGYGETNVVVTTVKE